ncbi:MAG: hypothetical protein QG604_809 [Candidatus Dependentiae bacterium]|nr:hypothetical protein [Candidatus Dependentiae bacterium]
MNSIWNLTLQRMVGLAIVCAVFYGVAQFTSLQLDYWRILPSLMAGYIAAGVVDSFLKKKK